MNCSCCLHFRHILAFHSWPAWKRGTTSVNTRPTHRLSAPICICLRSLIYVILGLVSRTWQVEDPDNANYLLEFLGSFADQIPSNAEMKDCCIHEDLSKVDTSIYWIRIPTGLDLILIISFYDYSWPWPWDHVGFCWGSSDLGKLSPGAQSPPTRHCPSYGSYLRVYAYHDL